MNGCATCGTPLEPHEGRGRPSIYCGEPCRRLAEFRIRALVKRIDKAENDLREASARQSGFGYWSAGEKRRRVRILKRWLAEDTAKLRVLLGGPAEDSK